ncbi:MAG TPA: phage tail protein [Pirellulales bacterium]|nr:phage tail protein [Pirellulales bacterium]
MIHRWQLPALVVVVAATAFAATGAFHAAESAAGSPDEVAELKAELRAVHQELIRLSTRVLNVEHFNPPVGTIVAYAGEWPPRKNETDRWTEEELGWMLCDGRPYPESLRELAAAIGSLYSEKGDENRLPGLRGKVLPGLDHSAILPREPRYIIKVGAHAITQLTPDEAR